MRNPKIVCENVPNGIPDPRIPFFSIADRLYKIPYRLAFDSPGPGDFKTIFFFFSEWNISHAIRLQSFGFPVETFLFILNPDPCTKIPRIRNTYSLFHTIKSIISWLIISLYFSASWSWSLTNGVRIRIRKKKLCNPCDSVRNYLVCKVWAFIDIWLYIAFPMALQIL